MKNQQLINYIIDKFDGVILDDYDREVHKVDGKPYNITFDRSRLEWSCSCHLLIVEGLTLLNVNILFKYKMKDLRN